MWLFKLFYVFLRNQLYYKPKGYLASRKVAAYLEENDHAFRSIQVCIGLAEPRELSCMVFFSCDRELELFVREQQLILATECFQRALVDRGYPESAIPYVGVEAHSEETIERSGGYYTYFK